MRSAISTGDGHMLRQSGPRGKYIVVPWVMQLAKKKKN